MSLLRVRDEFSDRLCVCVRMQTSLLTNLMLRFNQAPCYSYSRY